jgi:uncharacterized membrane protein
MMESGKTTNVGDIERVASGLAGGALVVWGLRRRSLGGLALAAVGAELVRRGISGHCAVYAWLGRNAAQTGPIEIESAITIDKPAAELYRAWCNPDLLSRVMGDFADVRATGERRWHWNAHGPADKGVEWESEITEEREGELLRWRSVGDAAIPNEGEVRFHEAPQGLGTEVHLAMRFDPPGGALGRAAVKMLGPTPQRLASRALLRFKDLVETGGAPAPRVNGDGAMRAGIAPGPSG